MLGALGQALNSVHFGSHERKVKGYLNEATPGHPRPQIREVQDLWTIFDAVCVEDSSHQRCKLTRQKDLLSKLRCSLDWNVTSFRKHIEREHPDVVSSEAVVQLLWRCFLYFAYHPFPRDVTNSAQVDSSGFQRAVSLLAAQGTDILGTQEEGDYFWRHDDAFFHTADYKRTLRSIGLPDDINNQPTDSGLEEDVMDVLAMTQPQSVSLAPSPDQLGPAARKLLDEGPTRTQYRVARRDLSTLLSLLLRLRLYKAKWGSYFHYGTFDSAEPGDEKLANILVNGLGEVRDGENLTSKQLLRAMDLLVCMDRCSGVSGASLTFHSQT
ncbi:hypothetical protein N7510_004824 [Penicillium lagena]|uniref:uncharacterized protein n=1 Tax=Penicillium lagena TaxID=94218 RepID=UPI002540CB03|nr:uncharacterized protein N7510_004824 [Penicillium lagena]KAJ5620840.1 hypothetical protein N7510_004824 [Penicillium lagena]